MAYLSRIRQLVLAPVFTRLAWTARPSLQDAGARLSWNEIASGWRHAEVAVLTGEL